MPTTIEQSTCSRCGDISHGQFCVSCDTCTCPSCCIENVYIKGETQECVSCGYHAFEREYCPCCSKTMGFEIHCGQAYQKGIPNMLGAGPQLIPLSCNTCNGTGIVTRRVGRGISSAHRQDIVHMIKSLISLNRQKRQIEAEKERKLEAERKQRERQAKIELARRESEKKERLQKEQEQKRRERYQSCLSEVSAINARIKELKVNGSENIKTRFRADSYTWNKSSSKFETLCRHYDIGKLDLTNIHYCFKKYIEQGKKLHQRPFELWLTDLRKKEMSKLSQFFERHLQAFKPQLDHNESSCMAILASTYKATRLSDKFAAIFPLRRTLNTQRHHHLLFDLHSYKTLSFHDVLMIRNQVWNKSWFHRQFNEATEAHYDDETDAMDKAFQKHVSAQLAFLHAYFIESQLNMSMPNDYLACSPELQKLKITLEYYESLERDGFAHVCGQYVDHLTLNEVLRKFSFEYHLDRTYQPPSEKPYNLSLKTPSLRSNKKVSFTELNNAWQTYQKERKSTLFTMPMSDATRKTYIAASNPLLSDDGRYYILRQYAICKGNNSRAFKKALNKTFGERYFNDYTDYDINPKIAT